MALRNDRILLQGFKDIAGLGERMGLQRNVVEAGKQYFKLTEEKHMVKNRPDVVAAVCLLLGCRKTGIGRTLHEFADLVNTSKHEFGKVFIAINKEIANLTNVNSEDISGRYCNALGLAHTVSAVVAQVCTNARTISELASRTPATIAGASIFLVAHLLDEPRQGREVAAMVKISETTLRQAYRILMLHLDRILDNEFSEYRFRLPSA
ncbi:transcription initiation factor IIB [Coelomomyces lativittatus]|nr:transcription initiation factor IIB [Coelomomyces lativittatus]KAJ1517103.1 transcription initiation factor IIB [Coelomomyces lativittatus]